MIQGQWGKSITPISTQLVLIFQSNSKGWKAAVDLGEIKNIVLHYLSSFIFFLNNFSLVLWRGIWSYDLCENSQLGELDVIDVERDVSGKRIKFEDQVLKFTNELTLLKEDMLVLKPSKDRYQKKNILLL